MESITYMQCEYVDKQVRQIPHYGRFCIDTTMLLDKERLPVPLVICVVLS